MVRSGIAGALLFVLVACGGGGSSAGSSVSPATSPLQSVASTCGLTLQDNGTTLVVNYKYADSPNLVCVKDGLQIPAYAWNQLRNATDLSGPITATWDSYTATNSYSGTDTKGTLTIHSTG